MLLPQFDTSSVILAELIQAANRLSSELRGVTPENAGTKRTASKSNNEMVSLRLG